ncbi:MAG: hypothetical protein QM479_10880 [Pseudomonadota bacterium]
MGINSTAKRFGNIYSLCEKNQRMACYATAVSVLAGTGNEQLAAIDAEVDRINELEINARTTKPNNFVSVAIFNKIRDEFEGLRCKIRNDSELNLFNGGIE